MYEYETCLDSKFILLILKSMIYGGMYLYFFGNWNFCYYGNRNLSFLNNLWAGLLKLDYLPNFCTINQNAIPGESTINSLITNLIFLFSCEIR